MQESTATIKLTKSEIEWNILALSWMTESSEAFRRTEDANVYKNLKRDFVKIKNDIIEGEKSNEIHIKQEDPRST